MFTVIICNSKIISDCNNKYAIYFKPFLNNSEVTFCEWYTEGETLDEAVPELKGLIAQKKDWRAVIVMDQSVFGMDNISKRNPFNYVNSVRETTAFSTVEEIQNYRTVKSEYYNIAVSNPLTKLAIWLCGAPMRKKPADELLGSIPELTDPEYFDKLFDMSVEPAEVEHLKARINKYEILSYNFSIDGELFIPPKQVQVLGERIKLSIEDNPNSQKKHLELDYSKFYEENLYPDKLRYLLYDIQYIKGIRNENAYFNFLSFLLIFASNECPIEALKPNRVYSVDTVVDDTKINAVCNTYISKLKATLQYLSKKMKKNRNDSQIPLDNRTARELFESNILIPVNVNSEFLESDLMAKYKTIGLSTDCPTYENKFWDNQYHTIFKKFLRYLREPRRAVKTAVTGEFRDKNVLNDERALQLNEFQREDVEFRLYDEEHNMIETATTHLFNTEEYKKKLADADKELRRGIAQRMTRKKTIVASLIAVGVYLIGFLPLIFGSVNNFTSVSFSLVITAVTLGLFIAAGLACLFVLRKRLIDRFKHFNYVMSGILDEIRRGLDAFAKYLSHACNVMREFSVLNCSESSFQKKQQILKKHELDINEKVDEVQSLFAKYLNRDNTCIYEVEPYEYDFTLMKSYEYEIPYSIVNRRIEYLQPGYEIVVPIDYIEAVTLTREELYD